MQPNRSNPLSHQGRLVQEIPVANGRIRILIDGDNDRLNMLIAPAPVFSRRHSTYPRCKSEGGGPRPDCVRSYPSALRPPYIPFMGAILFTCPSTRFTVQHWLDDDERASDDDYEGITCPACARVHFLNRSGKVLGSNDSAGGVGRVR